MSIILIFLGINLSLTQPNSKPGAEVSATITQRDNARRNDIERVSAGILQYQTNNNGKTPMQQNPMPKTGQFIQQYLVGTGESLDDFVDPDNTQYKLEFSNFNADEKYGLIDEMDHTIYVVGKATCNGEKITESEKARNYAISYKLESGDTYCYSNR